VWMLECVVGPIEEPTLLLTTLGSCPHMIAMINRPNFCNFHDVTPWWTMVLVAGAIRNSAKRRNLYLCTGIGGSMFKQRRT
jgi:hypothetical protein